jgi:zinc ribbon protein
MFCPKCATQNVDGASFCRSCGANISLVPQALTGQLPAAQKPDTVRSWRHRDRDRPPSMDEAIRSLMTGVGFLTVAIALFFLGRPIGAQVWWFWLLLPAFGMMGRGISEFVRAKHSKESFPTSQSQLPYAAPPTSLPPRNTVELPSPVPSVTEGTTRHLGAEAQTRHFDSVDTQKPS